MSFGRVAIAMALLGQVLGAFGGDWTCERIVPSESLRLRDPASITISIEQVLYVADQGHHRVVALDTTGKLIAETGGLGSAAGQFRWPRQVATSANGLFVLDYGNRRIEKFSRTLEYQGTVAVPGATPDANSQPEVIALAPQGDLYVYERDGGRLLHLDPLFRVVGDIGGAEGGMAIAELKSMTFAVRWGLVWWERGQAVIRSSDAMLNVSRSYPLPWEGGIRGLASADSCVLIAGDSLMMMTCDQHTHPLWMIAHRNLGLPADIQVTSIACNSRDLIFVLDGRSGSIYKVARRRE